MTLRTIIVDDEPTARRTLQNLLENYVDDVEVIALAEDVLSGVKAINNKKPDLVLLDVKMPNYSGFSLVDYFDELDFKILFTTAYEEYAQRAFREGASGYLLKPIDIDDLNNAVDKVKEEIILEQRENYKAPNKYTKFNKLTGTVILPSVGGLLKMHIDEILYIEAKGRQVLIHLIDNKKVLANMSTKSIFDLFAKSSLVRVHKSYIVNFTHVRKYTKGKSASLSLFNDVSIDIGKVFKEGINEIIGYLPK